MAASVSSGCKGPCAGSGPGNQAARLGLVPLGGGGRYREESKSMQREACIVSDSDDLDDHSLSVGWKGSLPLLAINFTSWAQREFSAHEWRAPTQDLRTSSLSDGVRLHRSQECQVALPHQGHERVFADPRLELRVSLFSVMVGKHNFKVADSNTI